MDKELLLMDMWIHHHLQLRNHLQSIETGRSKKNMDFSACWKWYKMKVIDKYRTASMSISLDG